jgi:nucleoside-diphosphate-sugar epimerase
MRVLILGGGGFLGKRLASELLVNGGLAQGELTHLTLMDFAFPDDMPEDSRLECIKADFSDEAAIRKVLQENPDVIFHLAAIVSGEAEKNFDLGMKVNFHASLQLLELCRQLTIHPRIVFASSCAVFGGDVSKVIKDNGYEDTDADWLNGLLKLKKFTHFDRNRVHRKIDINNLKFYHINKKHLIYTVVVTGDDDVDIVWEINDKRHKTEYALRVTIDNLLSRDWVIVKTN